MCASCTWIPLTRKLGVWKMLNAVYRSDAHKARLSHRTDSLHAGLSFLRLLSLYIRVRKQPVYTARWSTVHTSEILLPIGSLRNPYISANNLTLCTCPKLGSKVSRNWIPSPWTVSLYLVSILYRKVDGAFKEWRDGEETW
ncbi:hypothetical protein EVAR_5385_1 [Eumeta japonica]|uniref:Uncharacterized protein n=1 Tax=Eumeta variegata TaxID=151549 RepID=A0A4C1TP03_EUMVA|nr:hypothetical protein EVAR_5385_1 [Eumeta japonica]